MTDHPLWDNHAKQGLTRGLLVPPISYPKHNCWMCLQPAKVELEVVRNGGLLCPPGFSGALPMYPSFGPVALLGGDPVCHTPGLYSSVKSHAAICKLGAHAPGSWLTGYVFSPQLSGTRTLKGGLGCVLEHYGGHHYGLLYQGHW